MERMAGICLTGSADNTPLLFKTSGTPAWNMPLESGRCVGHFNPEIIRTIRKTKFQNILEEQGVVTVSAGLMCLWS